MLLAMILFLKFGFSFLSQIPFLMHPTVRYKAKAHKYDPFSGKILFAVISYGYLGQYYSQQSPESQPASIVLNLQKFQFL